ncbi:MAG: glycosyltransferase family 2 protein [Magnetococcales bacterium]|nr:glycosyltransferase family 2 protein [Magnetococcales bacterium]
MLATVNPASHHVVGEPQHPASFHAATQGIIPGLTSVLVPVFNNLQCVTLLYRSLAAQTTDHPIELIFIDNHSTEPGMDAFYDSIRSDPRVTILRNAGNLGFGKANNRGLQQSRGEFIALINSDMFFFQPWLAPILDHFAADAQCAAVQGLILLPAENTPLSAWKTQTCGARFDALGLPQYHLAGLQADAPEVQALTFLEAFMGTGVVLRRTVLEEVGFFDDEYDIVFMEDTDLSLRISAAGYRIRFAPQARLVHLHSASMPYLTQEEYDRSRRTNLAIYRRKWPLEKIQAILAAQGLRGDPKT